MAHELPTELQQNYCVFRFELIWSAFRSVQLNMSALVRMMVPIEQTTHYIVYQV